MDVKAIVAAVRRDAEDKVPFECCGVITAVGDVVPCTNVAKDRTQHFIIPAGEVTRIMRGHSVLYGMYHSHVGYGAYLSKEDLNGMCFDGIHIVVSVIDGKAAEHRGFLVVAGKVKNEVRL